MRRSVWMVGTALIAALALASPASANVGGGAGTTTGNEGHSVTGSGKFVFAGSGSSATVQFECDVTATPGVSDGKVPTAVRVAPPEEGGCILKQGGEPIKDAPGTSSPGVFDITQNRATADFGAGALEICWFVEAFFRDGSSLSHEGCADGDILPVTPDPA